MVYVGSVAEAVPRTTRWASILTSPDGVTWTINPNPMDAFGIPNNETYVPQCVAANDSEILMGTLNDAAGTTSNLFRSTNGATWTAITSPFDNVGGALANLATFASLAWNGSLWCAIGTQTGTGYQIVATSPDGITWTTTATMTSLTRVLLQIVWNGNYFVVTGDDFTDPSSHGGFVLASSDAITWHDQSLPTSNADGEDINPFLIFTTNASMVANTSTGEIVMGVFSFTYPNMFGQQANQWSLASCTDIGTGSPPTWSFTTPTMERTPEPVPGGDICLLRINTEWFIFSSNAAYETTFPLNIYSAYITNFNTDPSAWTQQVAPIPISVVALTGAAYSPELSQLLVIADISAIGFPGFTSPGQIATSTNNGATWTRQLSPLETESTNPNAGPSFPTDWAQDIVMECVTWSSAFSQWIVGCSQSRFARNPFGSPGRYWQP